MIRAFPDDLRGSLLCCRAEQHRRNASARAAVDDTRPHDHGANPFLGHVERQLLVRRTPRGNLRRIRRVRFVEHRAARVA